MSTWYKSDVPVFFTMYQRNAVGQWSYWTQSPPFAASATYTTATWTTPAIPTGTRAVTFGLTLISNCHPGAARAARSVHEVARQHRGVSLFRR